MLSSCFALARQLLPRSRAENGLIKNVVYFHARCFVCPSAICRFQKRRLVRLAAQPDGTNIPPEPHQARQSLWILLKGKVRSGKIHVAELEDVDDLIRRVWEVEAPHLGSVSPWDLQVFASQAAWAKGEEPVPPWACVALSARTTMPSKRLRLASCCFSRRRRAMMSD